MFTTVVSRASWARCLSVVVAALAVPISTPSPRPAFAQEDPSARLAQLIEKARGDYEDKDWDLARMNLQDAIRTATKAGLLQSEGLARAYLYLGALYVNGYQDKTRGQRNFGLALKIKPDLKLDGSWASPDAKATLEAARKELAAAAPAAPAAAPPPTPAPVAAPPPPPPPPADEEPDLPANVPTPLYCPNPDEAPPRTAMELRCVLQPGVEAARVLLLYRTPGAEDFTVRPASRSPKGWYKATIPAEAASGKQVQYFFEARSATDDTVASAGRRDSPNLIIVRAGATPIGGSLASLGLRRESGAEAGSASEDEDPLARRAQGEEAAAAEPPPRIWIGLGVGTGFGWHAENNLEWAGELEAPAEIRSAGPLVLSPEIAYAFSESFALGLMVRSQVIFGEGSDPDRTGAPAVGANSVLLRAMWMFVAGPGHITASVLGGGGEGVRLVVPPTASIGNKRTDTVRGGPGLVGAGVGYRWAVSRAVALTADLRALYGLPDAAAVADLGLGVAFGF